MSDLLKGKSILLTILFISLFSLLFSGCSESKASLINDDYHTAVYKNAFIQIEYPEFENASINQIVKDNALSVLKYYDEEDYPDLLISIGYSVETLNDKILSIVFEGTGKLSENFDRINRFKYSVNINLQTGKKLKLNDFVSVDNSLIPSFRTAANQLDEVYRTFFENQSDDEILEKLSYSDLLDFYTDISEQRDVFSYISNDRIFIVYPLPYALGYYTTVEL